MIEQEINHLRAPQVIFEIVFAVGAQQFLEHRRGRGAFGNCFEKLGRRLCDGIIAEQRLAKRFRRFRRRNRLVTSRFECANDFIDQVRAVGRINGD